MKLIFFFTKSFTITGIPQKIFATLLGACEPLMPLVIASFKMVC